MLIVYSVLKVSDEDEYKFQLIQFRESLTQGLFDVDIVPTTWIEWDNKENVCKIRYPPLYTAKICMQVQRYVQEEKLPPKHWPMWGIIIKGGAGKKKIIEY